MIKSLVLIVVATLTMAGCKDNEPKAKPSAGSAKLTGKDADVRDALVLDAALAKAKKEIAALEAAEPRDEDAIAKKRMAIDAVEQTLAKLRKRLDTPGAPAPGP